MSRHGDECRPPALHVHAEHPGRLGRIHNQGHAPLLAKLSNTSHGLDEPKHIRHMVADHRIHIGCNLPLKGGVYPFRVKQRPGRLLDLYPGDGVKRPGDGIVLIAGDHCRSSGPYQRSDGNVQPVGGV